MIHGPACNAKAFPLNCRYCKQRIFFFNATTKAGSSSTTWGLPGPCIIAVMEGVAETPIPVGAAPDSINWSPSSIPSIPGIDIYRGGDQSTGLLPGLKRGTDSIDSKVGRGPRKIEARQRDIMRIEPTGSRNVAIVGVVRERSQPDLNRRYGFGVGSIGFGELTKMVGGPSPDGIRRQQSLRGRQCEGLQAEGDGHSRKA